MARPSENLFLHSDYIGLSPSPDREESNCKFGRKRSLRGKINCSLRKNLFPRKYPSVFYKTKNVFSTGLGKINKALCDIKFSIQSAAQSLRFSSYKRYEFDESGKISTSQTPNRRVRLILGRTPTKLYSPFGIETPRRPK